MTTPIRRQLSTLLVILTALAGLPVSAALAMTATVHGQVHSEAGSIPAGSSVRLVPEGGGAAIDVGIATDSTFLLSQISEGAYRIEVIGPKGVVLGTGRAVIPAKASVLEITVRAGSASASAHNAPPATITSERALPAANAGAAAPTGSAGMSAGVLASTIIGGLVVGYFAGVEAEDDEDKCVSPSSPGCP